MIWTIWKGHVNAKYRKKRDKGQENMRVLALAKI